MRPTPDDIARAAARIADDIHRTPILTSRTLDTAAGAGVFLKAEILQRAGSFKPRGAFNKVRAEAVAGGYRGVAAVNSGGHIQAVALAAQAAGLPCRIVMPPDAPPIKVAARRGDGAETVVLDPFAEQRESVEEELAGDGWLLVPACDDPYVIAGQGTLTRELLDDTDGVDVLLVQIGGGGLISGAAIEAKGRDLGIGVIGVEPEGSDDTLQSLRRGERVRVVPDTVVDGLRVAIPGVMTFPIVADLVDDIVTVTDGEVARAMRFLFERMKLVVEPAGAAGVAAALRYADRWRGRRVGVILSGGNIAPETFLEVVGSTAD